MIQRYELDYQGGDPYPMRDGEWVKYEDHQKEVDDLRLINDKLLALNKQFKEL